MHPKLLVVGIDGATLDLVDPLVASGRLPNLAQLLDGGVSARTRCTWPAHTAPGWTSFVTGRRPGGHGIYQFFDTQEPGYGARIVGSADVGCATVWDMLSQRGWTIGLVNVPMSHPPRDLPGFQITWPLANTLRFCSPPGLLAEMARCGAAFRSDLTTMYRGDRAYATQALDFVAERRRSVRYLLREHPVDALMVVFTEVDRVCHHYWQASDPRHPWHTPGDPDSGAIEAVYQAVDGAVGELVETAANDETVVVVVSDHGSGPGHHGLAVHRVLEEAGLLRTTGVAAGCDTAAPWFRDGERSVDWERTRAYSPVPGSFGININVRGQQRLGCVDRRDADAVAGEVTSILCGLRTPSGSPVFRAVLPREEVYPGPQCASAPDLALIPADETVAVESRLQGPTWGPATQTGLHRHEGMWLQSSSAGESGVRLDQPVELTDLLPALLADLGVATPSRALAGVGVAAPVARAGDLTAEDSATIARLRAMGYL